MNGLEPNLLEKLFDDSPRDVSAGVVRQHSLEEFKASVALDLECLLNSRLLLREAALAGHPESARSVVAYGLNDFSSLSLASSHDRAYICRALERAIMLHEPRLLEVKVSLAPSTGGVCSLRFAISALLDAYPAREPVSFDAMLQPSTLQYAVQRARRAA